MKQFETCSPREADPFINRIGADWMLLCSSNGEEHNAMTVSWGCIGELWHKPVAICFIRPQRHTYGLVEASDCLALAHLPEGYREALSFCGSHSGRDGNKFEQAGLTCALTEEGIPYPEEADSVLICKKLYADDLREGSFLDDAVIQRNYPAKDYHRFYVCEILRVLVKKDGASEA